MLTPEQAAALLEKMARADWIDARVAAARALPTNARKVAYALLGRDEKGREPKSDTPYWMRNPFQAEARPLIDALSAEELSTMLGVLFGRLAPHVHTGYTALYARPYQSDYSRKAFRTPNLPQATQSARFHWLHDLLYAVGPYDQTIGWLAAWSAYLGWRQDVFGKLFAAVIDAGGPEGEEVFDILVASARGEHEVGAMGRHISRALLASSRPDGWEFIEQMLLAAQRQEGLRQDILETVDEAHPQAFRRMLRLILDHDLVRFSAAVRAVDVWLGLAWDSVSTKVVNDTVARLLSLLEDAGAPTRVLRNPGASPEELYLALWSIAFEDAEAAIPHATRLLSEPDAERRFIAAHLLSQLKLAQAYSALVPVLDDPDLSTAMRAFSALATPSVPVGEIKGGEAQIFEALERLVGRLTAKKKELKPLVWPWMVLVADREQVAGAMLHHLGARSPKRLIPHLRLMRSWERARVVDMLMEREKDDSEARDTIFDLVGDSSNTVREKALAAVAKFKITGEEATRFEALLTRKAGDLRRGVISLLLGQPDGAALESAGRLTSSRDPQQRLAGLELLRQLDAARRSQDECRAMAEEYRRSRPELDTDEEKLLESLIDTVEDRGQPLTIENGLGLYDPAERTPGIQPRPAPSGNGKGGLLGRLFQGADRDKKGSPHALFTESAATLARSVDDFVHAHRDVPVRIERGAGTGAGGGEELLANINWGFPVPERDLRLEEDLKRLPLSEELQAWWRNRPASMRDQDGFEVLRALAPFMTGHWGIFGYRGEEQGAGWLRNAVKVLYADFDTRKLRYSTTVYSILCWFLKMDPPPGAPNLLLEAVQTTFSLVPPDEYRKDEGNSYSYNPWGQGWRQNSRLMAWLELARYHRYNYWEEWTREHHIQLWRLLRWLDEPVEGMERLRPDLEITLAAHWAGGATEADLLDQLVGPRTTRSWGSSFMELRSLSSRRPAAEVVQYPVLGELVERCRRRILDVELARGDMPTPASYMALSLRWTGGLDTLVRTLAAMGRESFVRGWTYDAVSKATVFSHVVRATFPGEGDTHARFKEAMHAGRISEKRLLETAMYAPQWAAHVEHALGWPLLSEAVWWLHAHTKDTAWSVDAEIRENWTAQVSERTPLSGQSLLDGAVDVAWFWRVYSALGEERWERLYAVAPYASGGGGHKRAQLFADAMLGRLTKEELLGRITGKRHQDAVRALGLLQLTGEGGGKGKQGEAREAEILERYKVIQEFVRTAKQFGSQRQASEKLAASIGMENLARTASYPDPIRLEWAMEARAVEDLAAGPLSASVDGVDLELAVNDWGEAELTVTRGGKPLKNIPPKVKKDPSVVALKEREREVGRQASRMRHSLENAMCRGDHFAGHEVQGFFSHPILRPMVERLVFIVDGGPTGGRTGYCVDAGRALRAHDGQEHPIGSADSLRIAHPHDFLLAGEWHLWQHNLFSAERVQPFKQVFRELYPLTPDERAEGVQSRRYEGHQVNPRQALALLGTRGWVSHPEEGVKRTFHDADLSAWVNFLEGFYTPADVDGLTLEHIHFTRRGDWKPFPLEEVPPRIFSEVMRDLDLVVSVAHRGGVDPESSASTVEMRSALVKETCEMLEIPNVRLGGAHAFVEGKLGSYTVHLGSGIVHRQPGGALCIIPVHSQHRGRLFLPFADDDPKTAEVISKVLLLARDTEIKDPTILEQILASRT